MGKIIIGGGGISLDDVTAIPADILQGKTAYMMGGDDPAGGTMPNNGAWTGRIGVNGRAAIPAGYHNGSGYVDQSIPTMGAQTVTPGNSQKVVSCSGKYMTGNVNVPAVAGLTAANIKKGVVVGGVTGTFEGWVPTPQDLYYNGINNAGFGANDRVTLQAQQIVLNSSNYNWCELISGTNVTATGASKLVLQGSRFNSSVFDASGIYVELGDLAVGSLGKLPYYTGNFTVEIPINTNIARTGILRIRFSAGSSSHGTKGTVSAAINRIRLE